MKFSAKYKYFFVLKCFLLVFELVCDIIFAEVKMKKLLQIALGLFMFSIFPMITWLVLGATINESIVNVYSLTYPAQFLWLILKAVFSSGANIKHEKEKNPNAVLSGMTLGIVVSTILFGTLAIFVDEYIAFMNMDPEVYHTFALYSIGFIYLEVLVSFVMNKFYYEDKEKLANTHSLIFNVVNMVLLVGLSLITKNQTIIVLIPLSVLAVYTIVLVASQYKKFKMEWSLKNNFKYQSSTICSYLLLGLMYLFGFSNAFQAGEEYISAINFVTLITDPHWDAIVAITTLSEIELAKNEFNFKKHIKNSFALIGIVFLSVGVLFAGLFSFYDISIKIALVCLILQFVDFATMPLYYTFDPFMQLEYSPKINTLLIISDKGMRFLLATFLPTPFCTEIAQLVASIYIIVVQGIIVFKNFKLSKQGMLERKTQIKNKAQTEQKETNEEK